MKRRQWSNETIFQKFYKSKILIIVKLFKLVLKYGALERGGYSNDL